MRSWRLPRFSGIWLGTAAIFLIGFLINPRTVSESTVYSMLPFFAILAIAAIGQTLVVMQRGLDLSVAGAIAAGAVAFTKTANVNDEGIVAGIVVALAVVALAGLITGIAVTRFHVTPLVATLAINALLLAFVNWYSRGFPTGAPDAINQFALGRALGLVPNLVVIAIVLVLISHFLLRSTVIGRRFTASGENPRAARAAGIPVIRYQVATYVIASLFYGVAGILLAAFIKTPPIFSGTTYLLGTVAAVVLGGTALTGGIGSIIATTGGALFMSQLGAIVLGIGLPTSAQQVLQASAIILVVGLRGVYWTGARDRLRSMFGGTNVQAETAAAAPPPRTAPPPSDSS
ncbi:MAG TPA: ABC transporter permease [Candidatus Limnocylindria bacterium]|nr:ABC transporter permease [Candidatus Limnocylindria bacterium]